MRTFTTIILLLIAFGLAFNYAFENRDVITEKMGRFCNVWSDCDDAGNRVEDNDNVVHGVFGR